MHNEHSPCFYLLGGRGKTGETAEQAVVWEILKKCKNAAPLPLCGRTGAAGKSNILREEYRCCFMFSKPKMNAEITAAPRSSKYSFVICRFKHRSKSEHRMRIFGIGTIALYIFISMTAMFSTGRITAFLTAAPTTT